jgi:tetratricopeptide (TPR) repeat protein
MVGSKSEQDHPTHDQALSLIAKTSGAIGEFVLYYPGTKVADETEWLESWFRERTNKHFTKTLSSVDEIKLPTPPAAPSQEELLAHPIRLVSIQPHYFRGFREVKQSIGFSGDLVVIDGRNTSGKTSLAEALEWLFTGCLSRRESMELGSPHELENCVGNEFCPDSEETWVAGTFIPVAPGETEPFTLKRVLKEDYGTTIESKCTSILFLNEKELTAQEEVQVLDRFFASEPPLLMQHTLRLFVENNPKKRRQYFERLLHLDELTNLISKAVIGDARLPEFPSLTGSAALRTWEMLGSILESAQSQRVYKQTSRTEEVDLHLRLTNTLITIAHHEFSDLVSESSRIDEITTTLAGEQSRVRQRSFPLLTQLMPQRQIQDGGYQRPYNEKEIINMTTDIRTAWQTYEAAKEAAQLVGKDRLAISGALKILLEGDIIQHEAVTQICPICAYEKLETLTSSRIKEIESWFPTQEAESAARQALQRAMGSLHKLVRKALLEHDELLPELPSTEDFEGALKEVDDELKHAVEGLRKVREKDDVKFKEIISQDRILISEAPAIPSNTAECESYVNGCNQIFKRLENLPSAAQRYRDALRTVEAAVGAAVSIDPAYRLRASWLVCFENIAAIVADLMWEQAKRQAQKDLERIREALMEYRKQFLESKRISFNQGIDSVWKMLRADRYSSFSKLHIPPPSGKGFPVEIEIKAVLDDGQQQKEVDALRVFSESQVNALGIAAFVTRSKLLGHKILIFDDPVQSMDEEHFKTFAEDVLPHVLNEGFQVILLTHNDLFARDVSHCHYDRPGYVTMSVRLSRRDGCVVEEGNRRFSERIGLAEKKVDDGDFKKAWELIREAIERLYMVVYVKYGPSSFKPDSWQDQPAEYMFDNGAGKIIDEKAPEISSKLKDILVMTAAGSHDKSPKGETDLRNSIKFLKSLPEKLQVGG